MADVVVIGGGLGGLAGAIRAATLGHSVRLYEKTDALGGKMGERRIDGYRFDTGPSLLTMPFVIDTLFEHAGKARSEFVQFDPLPLICRYRYPGGATLDASSDLGQFLLNLEEFRPGAGAEFRRYMHYANEIYDLTADVFLFTPFHEIGKLLRRKHLPSLLGLPRIDAFRTVHEANKEYFRDPRLVQLFDRYATYNGSDPHRAPATLNVIPYVEYGLGGQYVRGGMYRLVEALDRLARELGVTVRTDTPVERIVHRKGRVVAVQVDEQEQACDAVLCNMDVVETYRRLLPERGRMRARLDKLEPSLSGLVFLWGVRGEHDALAHHNILFSNDYRREFEQLFTTREAPDDPTIYVSITSRADTGHAPDGHENWFVLVNMPYVVEGQDWDGFVEKTRERVLARLREDGLDVANRIEVEEVIRPLDFCDRLSSNAGSIYGLSSNGRTAAFRRPANRSRDLKGLYFAGGSVHPGGGIPLTVQSGMMAAELLDRHDG